MAPPRVMGIYPSDSVSEVAQSLPLDPLASGSADALAADVEYRLHLIAQEAKKFMVNGKRGTLLPEDVEYAMEALNVEPILVPPRPLPQPAFAPVTIPQSSGSSQQIYHVPDDEIDFSTFLKEPLPPGLANSAGMKWRAHWLAVEGVQPAIPENPPQKAGPSQAPQPSTGNAALRPSAKAQLPQELQLYFTRLTSALVPPVPSTSSISADTPGMADTERHRVAALASLSSDAAVAGILVYLVRWLVESINKCLMSPTTFIGHLLDAVQAVLDNESVFMEPYLHQLLAPLMSVLLTVPLGPHPPAPASSGQPMPYEVRMKASDVLGKIVKLFGDKYSGLIPRLASTLNKTFNMSPFPSPLGASHPPAGRYEGSILGLAALGAPSVRSSLFADPTVLLRIDDLSSRLYPGQEGRKTRPPLIRATITALSTLAGPKPAEWKGEADLNAAAREFGENLARGMEKRPWMTSELLRLRRDAAQQKSESMAVDPAPTLERRSTRRH